MRRAREFHESVLPLIQSLQAEGIQSPTLIARNANERGVTARRGGPWSCHQVSKVLARAQLTEAGEGEGAAIRNLVSKEREADALD